MAWRVAGAMAHGKRAIADRDGIAILQPARGRKGLGPGKAKHLALLRQAVNPELVAGVRANDGQLQPLGQLAGAAGVVDMGVGQPDLFERKAQALHLAQHPVQVATGVDNRRVQRLVAPDQRAILLKRGDGDDEIAQHGASI